MRPVPPGHPGPVRPVERNRRQKRTARAAHRGSDLNRKPPWGAAARRDAVLRHQPASGKGPITALLKP